MQTPGRDEASLRFPGGGGRGRQGGQTWRLGTCGRRDERKEEEGEEKKGRKNLSCSAGHEWFHQDHRCPGAEGTCWQRPRPRRDGGGSQHARCARSVVRAAHGRRGFGLSEAAGPTGQKLPSFVLPAPGELVVHFPHLHGHRGAVFMHSRIHRHS